MDDNLMVYNNLHSKYKVIGVAGAQPSLFFPYFRLYFNERNM